MRQHHLAHDSAGLRWLTSSRCSANNDCVEIARTESAVFVRDSTDREGGRLRVPLSCWSRFTEAVRTR